MNPKRTIVAGLIFAALLAALRADVRRRREAETRRTKAERLIPQPSEAFSRIEVERADGALELAREGDRWSLLRPVRSPADAAAVGDLIYYLDRQQKIDVRAASPQELESYGLVRPPLRVTVAADGAEAEFSLGFESPVLGEYYARESDRFEYFTLSPELQRALTRPARDYRDRSLTPFAPNEATTFTLLMDSQLIEATQQSGEWRLTRPIQGPADPDAIRDLLAEIQMTQAVDFLDTDTLELAPYGLAAPSHVAILDRIDPDTGRPEQATLTFGYRRILDDPPTYYAHRQDRPVVMTVPFTLPARLRPTVDALRSKRAISLDAREIASLQIDLGSARTSLRRDESGRWRFEDRAHEVDRESVERVVGRLSRARIVNFPAVEPFEEDSGLAEPFIRVRVADADGGRVAGLETGRDSRAGGVFARLIPSGEIVEVEPDLPAQLFRRAEAFRSKILFSFSPGLVHSIVVEEPGRTSALTQGDMGWELASIDPPGSPIQVRGSLVESIIQGLLRLVWFDALDPNVEADLRSISEQGLTRPWRVVRLLDARGGELAVLGQGSTNDGRTFVRRGREDGAEYFAIEALLFESLARPLEAVLPRNSMRE